MRNTRDQIAECSAEEVEVRVSCGGLAKVWVAGLGVSGKFREVCAACTKTLNPKPLNPKP